MAALMKIALVIAALVCFMEFVEMARLRRDDSESADTNMFQPLIDTFGTDFEQNDIFKEFKVIMTKFSADEAKSFIENVNTAAKVEINKAKETE